MRPVNCLPLVEKFSLILDGDRAYVAPYSLCLFVGKNDSDRLEDVLESWKTMDDYGYVRDLPPCVIAPKYAMCDTLFFFYVRRDRQQLEELGVPVDELIAAYNKVAPHLTPSHLETFSRSMNQLFVTLEK